MSFPSNRSAPGSSLADAGASLDEVQDSKHVDLADADVMQEDLDTMESQRPRSRQLSASAVGSQKQSATCNSKT